MLRLLLALLACLSLAPAEERAEPLAEARARFLAMDAAQRAEIERRFAEFSALDAESRAAIEERYALLRSAEEQALAELPVPERRRLEELPEAQRGALRRELARDALAERGRRAWEHLSAAVRKSLSRAAGPELVRIVRELKDARRDERLTRALERLASELGLPEEERAFAELSAPEREAKLFELFRARLERRVARDGLPEWLPAEEWKSLRALAPVEFKKRLERRRCAPLRPEPAWLLELGHLPAAERRAVIAQRLKARALEFVAERPDAPSPSELERLRGLEGDSFFRSVRPWTERARPFPARRTR
jgi:hypothetical protein